MHFLLCFTHLDTDKPQVLLEIIEWFEHIRGQMIFLSASFLFFCLHYEKLLQGGMRVYVCVRDTSPPGLHVLLSFWKFIYFAPKQ